MRGRFSSYAANTEKLARATSLYSFLFQEFQSVVIVIFQTIFIIVRLHSKKKNYSY